MSEHYIVYLCNAVERMIRTPHTTQALNIDRSGSGDLAMFQGHLRAVSRDPDATTPVAGDSTRMARSLTPSVTPVRLFSLDGGHTAAHAVREPTNEPFLWYRAKYSESLPQAGIYSYRVITYTH